MRYAEKVTDMKKTMNEDAKILQRVAVTFAGRKV
jgi:hypothetical protein